MEVAVLTTPEWKRRLTRMTEMTSDEKLKKVKEIISKHKIDCGESLWQSDVIQQDLCHIVEEICEVVGWAE
jgi:hypothetical protein